MVGAVIGWILLVLLALYGCVALIRRLCLWFVRCPGCAVCCRVVVPRNRAALAPLVRCLQGQAVWDDSSGCRCTLVLLPEDGEESYQEIDKIFEEASGLIPVTKDQLTELLDWLIKE